MVMVNFCDDNKDEDQVNTICPGDIPLFIEMGVFVAVNIAVT